ncbi:MAG: ABC transporter permease, partial [Bacteroidota bacterium]
MIGHYTKIILRNLKRNQFYFAINVLGLGIALACCIIAYLNYKYDQQFDSMHLDTEDVFRVTCVRESNQKTYGFCPTPLAEVALTDFPQVVNVVNLISGNTNVKFEDQVFGERLLFSSTTFFDFFTFPLRYGNYNALLDPSQVILDAQTAVKYFGDRNPVGEVLTIYAGLPYQKELTVGAVVEAIPLNSSIRFKLLTHQENYLRKGKPHDFTQWNSFVDAAFLRLQNPSDQASIQQQLNQYIDVQQAKRPDWKLESFGLDPLRLTAHNAREYRANYLGASFPPAAVWGPILMGLLLLITACLNFANTSVSLSSRRLKEMGVRKVMGSSRQQLVGQLLGENLLIAF